MQTLQNGAQLRRAPASYGIGGATVRTLAKSAPPPRMSGRVVTPSNPPDDDDDGDVDGVVDLLPAGRPATEPLIEQPIPGHLLQRFERCGMTRAEAAAEITRQSCEIVTRRRVSFAEAYRLMGDAPHEERPLMDADGAEQQAGNLSRHLGISLAEARGRIGRAGGCGFRR